MMRIKGIDARIALYEISRILGWPIYECPLDEVLNDVYRLKQERDQVVDGIITENLKALVRSYIHGVAMKLEEPNANVRAVLADLEKQVVATVEIARTPVRHSSLDVTDDYGEETE